MNVSKILYLILFALMSADVFAAEDPAIKLGKTLDTALDVLYSHGCVDDGDEQKQAKVRQILKETYDWTIIVRYVAGSNWKRFQPSEQDRFVQLIEALALKACLGTLKGKARPVIEFQKTRNSGKRAEVSFVVIIDERPIKGAFRFARRLSGWEIYDIVIENISFGKNYRQQLNDYFRRRTAAELIEKLEKLMKAENLNESLIF